METPDPFDPGRLSATGEDLKALAARPRKGPPRHRPGAKFLRGPVPWDWLERAGRLPGQALAVGLVLWKEAGCKNSRTVKLSLSGALPLGLSKQSARRGLRLLGEAGLVSARQQPGHGLEVTLLEAPPAEPP
jgi:DNA-binding transcriptional ArsR family regulator